MNENFKFDCVSFSKKKTLRGLHIQIKNSQEDMKLYFGLQNQMIITLILTILEFHKNILVKLVTKDVAEGSYKIITCN